MTGTKAILRRSLFAGAALLCAAPALAQQGTPIRLGAVLSVTGPASFLGDPEDKTLKLYVERINKAGGVLGRPLQLVIYDDGGDANKARTFATRLLEDDEVIAMVGGTTTGSTISMPPASEIKGTCASSNTGIIAMVVPVVVPPTMATTLSSSMSRVAKVRALLASPPSS